VGLQAAKVYLELSKNDLKRSDMEVKQMVTIAYGNVLVAQRNSEILAGNVESLKKSAFETEELYKNGFIEEQDKDQIQLTLANVQNSYNNAVRMIEISKNQLKFTMGINVESGIELTDDLVTVTKASTSEAYLSNEFNPSNHVEFQIINTQKTATELLLKQQKSTALPRLSAFYNFSSNSFANEFDFLDNKRFYNGQLIGLNLNVPIFSGLSRYNRIQQAEIDVEKIETTKTQVEQQLILEAHNAKSEYTFTLSQYNTTESNMELAQSIYTKTKVKYEEGISSSIELTTANNQLLESQANFINAAFQLIQAKSNLDKALNQ
jgi:outer membrane protein TolC